MTTSEQAAILDFALEDLEQTLDAFSWDLISGRFSNPKETVEFLKKEREEWHKKHFGGEE